MWVPASVTVKPLGFGGAVQDRRIIVFVKNREIRIKRHRQSC